MNDLINEEIDPFRFAWMSTPLGLKNHLYDQRIRGLPLCGDKRVAPYSNEYLKYASQHRRRKNNCKICEKKYRFSSARPASDLGE
jgi:hypothetical protein